MLADIAAVIGAGDHAAALMMLGDESGPEASAAVSSYRAQCAAALGDFEAAERHLRVALDLVERRMAAVPADEGAKARLAASLSILPKADAPITPTLEVISPELTAVRLRRMLAALFMSSGANSMPKWSLASCRRGEAPRLKGGKNGSEWADDKGTAVKGMPSFARIRALRAKRCPARSIPLGGPGRPPTGFSCP